VPRDIHNIEEGQQFEKNIETESIELLAGRKTEDTRLALANTAEQLLPP
jgi:hypothetical protein